MELVVLVGLPGSGKSTFAREHLPRHLVVSKDLMPNVRERGLRQLDLVGEALRRGDPVVVDNTNAARADRAPLVALGRELGARVAAYFFDGAPRDCLARNRRREGRERVPDVAILAAAKRLERPEREEGFDLLRVVRVRPGGGFDVEDV